ncbi:hypothetical protein BDZ89DRAFT_1082530 [Hymenopellis radicata]|nr:hypothetical protein BDZ89DRAFT_1082530 [Hymenopellis radicata]
MYRYLLSKRPYSLTCIATTMRAFRQMGVTSLSHALNLLSGVWPRMGSSRSPSLAALHRREEARLPIQST